MSDDRLSALSILSIERDCIQKLDIEDIILILLRRKLEKFNFEAAIDLYLPHTFVHHFRI